MKERTDDSYRPLIFNLRESDPNPEPENEGRDANWPQTKLDTSAAKNKLPESERFHY